MLEGFLYWASLDLTCEKNTCHFARVKSLPRNGDDKIHGSWSTENWIYDKRIVFLENKLYQLVDIDDQKYTNHGSNVLVGMSKSMLVIEEFKRIYVNQQGKTKM